MKNLYEQERRTKVKNPNNYVIICLSAPAPQALSANSSANLSKP